MRAGERHSVLEQGLVNLVGRMRALAPGRGRRRQPGQDRAEPETESEDHGARADVWTHGSNSSGRNDFAGKFSRRLADDSDQRAPFAERKTTLSAGYCAP